MYIFEASIDTSPIYTDADTKQDKLKRASSFIPKLAVVTSILTIITYWIALKTDSQIVNISCILLSMVAGCSISMTVAFYYRTIKLIRKGDD
jgi:uncharacterized membrane protein